MATLAELKLAAEQNVLAKPATIYNGNAKVTFVKEATQVQNVNGKDVSTKIHIFKLAQNTTATKYVGLERVETEMKAGEVIKLKQTAVTPEHVDFLYVEKDGKAEHVTDALTFVYTNGKLTIEKA